MTGTAIHYATSCSPPNPWGAIPRRGSHLTSYARVGNLFSTLALGKIPVPFPADYLYGLDLRQQCVKKRELRLSTTTDLDRAGGELSLPG